MLTNEATIFLNNDYTRKYVPSSRTSKSMKVLYYPCKRLLNGYRAVKKETSRMKCVKRMDFSGDILGLQCLLGSVDI